MTLSLRSFSQFLHNVSTPVPNLIFHFVSSSPDIPDMIPNLELFPSLTLEWTRPQNVPTQVSVNYTVEINSTDVTPEMNFRNTTSATSFSVLFLEGMLPNANGQCVEFEFFVSATNEAGMGLSNRVLDTVPICKLKDV